MKIDRQKFMVAAALLGLGIAPACGASSESERETEVEHHAENSGGELEREVETETEIEREDGETEISREVEIEEEREGSFARRGSRNAQVMALTTRDQPETVSPGVKPQVVYEGQTGAGARGAQQTTPPQTDSEGPTRE